MYELLLKGAKVIDPSQGINQNMDVSISGGKIGRVALRSTPKKRQR